MAEAKSFEQLAHEEETKQPPQSFPELVWMTLSRIDMSSHVSTKKVTVKAKDGRKGYEFTLDYISWVTAWQQLMESFPESTFEFDDPHMFESGTGEQWITVTIIKGDDKLIRRWWLPFMDQRNQPVQQPSSTQINNTRMRVLTKCIAMCGLGIEVYGGEDVTDQEQDATPIKSKSVTQTVIDEMNIKVDQEQCNAHVAGIQAALYNEDNPRLFNILDQLANDADMKIMAWSRLNSKERSAIKKLSAGRDGNDQA